MAAIYLIIDCTNICIVYFIGPLLRIVILIQDPDADPEGGNYPNL